MAYCEYCHESTEANHYHPACCGQCGAEYKIDGLRRNNIITSAFGNLLTPESAAGMNRAAQDLRRAQEELNDAIKAESITIGEMIAPRMSQWLDALEIPA